MKHKGPTFELLHRLWWLFLRAGRILSCIGRVLELPQDEWHLRVQTAALLLSWQHPHAHLQSSIPCITTSIPVQACQQPHCHHNVHNAWQVCSMGSIELLTCSDRRLDSTEDSRREL
jgi:hypothetical protein